MISPAHNQHGCTPVEVAVVLSVFALIAGLLIASDRTVSVELGRDGLWLTAR